MLAGRRLVTEERRQLYYEARAADSGRLQRLMEELLNFGRMETGAMRYRRDPLDAAEVVRSAIAGFERQCEQPIRVIRSQLHLTYYCILPPSQPRPWTDNVSDNGPEVAFTSIIEIYNGTERH